jgi:hypothetical protein
MRQCAWANRHVRRHGFERRPVAGHLGVERSAVGPISLLCAAQCKVGPCHGIRCSSLADCDAWRQRRWHPEQRDLGLERVRLVDDRSKWPYDHGCHGLPCWHQFVCGGGQRDYMALERAVVVECRDCSKLPWPDLGSGASECPARRRSWCLRRHQRLGMECRVVHMAGLVHESVRSLAVGCRGGCL